MNEYIRHITTQYWKNLQVKVVYLLEVGMIDKDTTIKKLQMVIRNELKKLEGER